MAETPLRDLALAELERRVAQANAAIRARQRTPAQCQPHLRLWAAIAAYFHADVRPLVVPQPGVACEQQPDWLDFLPADRADHALRKIAEECRRAYTAALGNDGDPTRAANLARLDERLSLAAKLPAWQPEPKRAEAA